MTSKRLRKCPACGKPKLERQVGAGAGVIFKGSGSTRPTTSVPAPRPPASEKPASETSSSSDAEKTSSEGKSGDGKGASSGKGAGTQASTKTEGAKKKD